MDKGAADRMKFRDAAEEDYNKEPMETYDVRCGNSYSDRETG